MQSERIKEFLKYASPRLDYIEQCMEKQAANVNKLKALFEQVRSLTAPGGKGLGALKDSGISTRVVGPVLRSNFTLPKQLGDYQKERDALVSFFGTTDRLVKGDALWKLRAPTTLPSDWRQLGASYDASVRQLEGLKKGKSSKAPAAPNTLPADWRQLGDSYNAAVRQLEELKKGKSSKAPADKGDVPSWWNDATKNVGAWVGKHPAITAALTGAGGGALGGGIGYGIGSGSGQQDGFDAASAYYKMREALQRHNLLAANDNILSRLANVFGGGDLSNLIG